MPRTEQIKLLMQARNAARENVARLAAALGRKKNLDVDDLKVRQSKLEEYYATFHRHQLEIEVIVGTSSIGVQQIEERERFEEQYFDCAKLIR